MTIEKATLPVKGCGYRNITANMGIDSAASKTNFIKYPSSNGM